MTVLGFRLWTLFGPYAVDRWGPQGNGRQREISNVARPGTHQNARNQLEVGVRGDSGEAECLFRREVERHSGMIPNTIGA